MDKFGKGNLSDEEWATRIFDGGFYHCSNDPKIIMGGVKEDNKILCNCGELHYKVRLRPATAAEFVDYEKNRTKH